MPPVFSRPVCASSSGPPRYSCLEIRAEAIRILGYQPCLWQIRVVEAILKRDGDVVCIAATGSGKTLTFWLPLLFRPTGIQLVISPLNILGEQNVKQLADMGLKGINITAETANADNFRDIEEGKYRVIVTNVETLMQQDGGFERLWKKPEFTRRLISIVWDEAHCVSKWAGFRPEYKEVGRLRYLIPRDIPFVLVSATLPPAVLTDVMNILQVSLKKVEIIRRSNDRPNINLVVREMKYSMSSFKDLAFLIPEGWQPGDPLPPKFLIFFDSIADSVEAAKFLRTRLPLAYRHKIKWFNSEMSPEFKAGESDALKAGVSWGLNCTDSFGMGLDLSDILLIIQWRSTCDMCTLWQRLGRAARALHLTATGLFLVEPKRFDENLAKAEARAAKRAELSKKRKLAAAEAEHPPSKRAAVTAAVEPDVPISAPVIRAAPDAPVDDHTVDDTAADTDADADTDTVVDAVLPVPDGSRADYSAERRAVYEAVTPSYEPTWKKKTKKKGTDRLEPALDDFINAATRQPERPCTPSDHRECQPRFANGCPRCIVKSPTLCCELCSPDDFADFARVTIPKPKQQPSRTRLADYVRDKNDCTLRDDLHLLRKERTIQTISAASFRSHGAGSIMPDEVLDRIVDCAHFYKITTLADLLRETTWHRVAEDGARVLSLISRHKPAPPPAPDTLILGTPLRAVNLNSAPSTSKAPRRCGNCLQLGHNSRNRLCPKYRATPSAKTPRSRPDENTPATPQSPRYSFDPAVMSVAPRRSPRSPPTAGPSTLAPMVPRPRPRPLNFSAPMSALHIALSVPPPPFRTDD
ncbi:P-loop containing nucleoside triphosphate hydrolase protein [Mycena polygramma]|nr:P-loop containing nucleoside triphosphate hydrolase protein [Mycena polygramma]